MFDKIPQVFISYSWTSKEYQQLIVDLASRMRHDGVDVKLDVWDLKEGQDKYAYMEQCVTNPEIDKVLILSDRIYSEKADARKGGVGDETTIISAEVYGNADQHKFIPVVMERDEEGKEYLPTYLKSRMYRDLSGENYEEEYEALLRPYNRNNCAEEYRECQWPSSEHDYYQFFFVMFQLFQYRFFPIFMW